MTLDQEGTTVTLMDKITAADIITQVRRFAELNPNFVYVADGETDQCRYFEEGGGPGCIVGHALDAFMIGECEEYVEASEALHGLGIRGTREQFNWLDSVQDAQDKKIPWGVAVKVADGELDLRQAVKIGDVVVVQ